MSSKNYKKRSSSSEDTETRKRKRDQKYNSDNENKSVRRDREDDDDTYKSKEKESRSKDKIKSEREKRSRSRDRHKIARDRSRDRLKPRDGRNRDRTRSSRDERERSRERSKSKEKSKSFRDERTKSRERSKSMERNKSSRDGRGKDESWSNDRNRFRRRRDSNENDNSYRGRNDDRTRYWDRDAEGRDMNMYRDRQRNLSEERHQQVVQSSYYGTELKNNNEDPKNKKDGSENKKEDDKLENENKEANNPEVIPPKQKKTVDLLTSRTGGAYIPPAKLRMMQAEINDKSGVAYQRIAWEALKKSIHGYINKVNTSNIGPITRELLKENIVRGRGLLARSIIQAQAASLTFTPVYAALVAVINSKFPNIGELILKRLAIQFKRGFRRDDKAICISSTTFIAHLVNQQVAHEILILEILTLLIQSPTDDSIEVAIAILKECGMKLTILCKKGIETIFEMLRNILHEGSLDKRVQYMIEVMFQIRKDGFKDYESVHKELDLVEEEDQITHLVNLDDANDGMDILNVFKFDAEYIANEDKYKELSKEILNSDDEDDDEENDSDEEEEGDSDENSDGEKADNNIIVDNTETNLTALRRTIYLTIHSSLDFEECAHKLMKMQLKPGQEIEMCHMFLDCCAEMRTYEKFFGLLAGRFCAINKIYVQPFQEIFRSSYDTIHRLETNKLRNVSKFFAHLLMTDSISWEVLAHIKLNEEDTTSSSRVFIKILFQELSEYMGLPKLNEKLKNEELQEAFSGLFPKDDPKNTRFAINFFTSIGLGGLTDDLREHLKNRPKAVPEAVVETRKEKSSSSSSSSSESSSTSSSSSESSSSDSESSEDDKRRKRKDKGRKKKAVVVKRRDGKEKNKSDRNKREKRESPKVKRHDKKQKKTKRR